MTGNLDRYGEPIEDEVFSSGTPPTRPTRKARIAELRRILKDARDRREAQP